MYMCGHMCCVMGSNVEISLVVLIFSFHHVCSRDQSPVARLGGGAFTH